MSSSTVGAVSNSKNMGFDVEKEVGEKSGVEESGDESVGNVKRSMSEEASFCATEDEDEDEEGRSKIQLGPLYTLKEQLEKDKVCFLVFGISMVKYTLKEQLEKYICKFSFVCILRILRMMRV